MDYKERSVVQGKASVAADPKSSLLIVDCSCPIQKELLKIQARNFVSLFLS